MISYEPLWKTLKEKGLSAYDLIQKHGMSANTIHRIKKNKAITTKTIAELCFILDCNVDCIIKYVQPDT